MAVPSILAAVMLADVVEKERWEGEGLEDINLNLSAEVGLKIDDRPRDFCRLRPGTRDGLVSEGKGRNGFQSARDRGTAITCENCERRKS